MRKWFFVAATTLCISSAYWMVAHAATSPAGPYTKSCTKCSTNGKNNTLYCTCQTAAHKPNQTSLHLPCNGEINNCNGSLRCGPC